jgi:hypothetical protein
MATYWDIINRNDLTPEQKAQEIQAIGELERKQIDRENLGAKARIGLGATLQGVSALPVFNIPYIGTGLGGALFETGNAIMQGKTKEDIAKDAGTGFVVGETVGAIPYVGKAAAKTKAGQAAGNQASKLFNYLTDTKVGQKVAEIAPKIEDALMTDIKAFNPFKQTQIAYHGSPYDFAKFSNEAIGTGEGAQAHGVGHYAALDKDVADIRYRQALTGDDFDNMQYFYNGRKIEDKREKAILSTILENGKDKVLQVREKSLPWSKYNAQEYDEKLKEIEFIKAINENLIKKDTDKGQLYKLSIPKDDVMLREDYSYNKQPPKVKKALDDILNKQLKEKNIKNLGIDTQTSPGTIERTLHTYKYYPGTDAGHIYDIINNNNNATEIFNNAGIKGISYNGGIDGEARVVFNPDDIEIVRKYYNQPELFQKLTGQTPNTGAVASNLYEYLKN